MPEQYTDPAASAASNCLGGVIEKPGAGPLLLKILVPAYAAGSIIGKKINPNSPGLYLKKNSQENVDKQ